MIVNVSVIKNLLRLKRFALSVFFILFLITNFSFGQTAESEINFAVCKACHTIGGGKLVGPDLKGITERRDEVWLIKFIQNSQQLIDAGDPVAIQVFEENSKIPMPPNPQLSEEQVKDILLYIENDGKVAESELAEAKEEVIEEVTLEDDKTQLLYEQKKDDARHLRVTFFVMLVLVVISLFDLLVTKIIKHRWIHTIIILVSLLIIGEVIFVEATNLGRQQYYQPEQPVWFLIKFTQAKIKLIVSTVTSQLTKVCTLVFRRFLYV